MRAVTRTGRNYDRDLKMPGIMAPTGMWQGVTFALVGSRSYFMRVIPSRVMRIAKVTFGITTAAGANDKCQVGICKGTDLTRLGQSAEKEGLLNALGIKTVELEAPITITPGNIYYASFSCGALGGTAAQIGGIANNNGIFGDLISTALPHRMCCIKTGAYPLPAGPTEPDVAGTPCPVLGLIEG